ATTAIATLIALLARPLSRPSRSVLYFACLFPLGVHIAFRVFGVQYLLSAEGPAAAVFQWSHLPFVFSNLLFTRWATILGLIHWTFPTAAPILLLAVSRLDQAVIESALLLGVTRRDLISRIILPQLRPALLLTLCLVFCLAYG